jgi:hypothetical protein
LTPGSKHALPAALVVSPGNPNNFCLSQWFTFQEQFNGYYSSVPWWRQEKAFLSHRRR